MYAHKVEQQAYDTHIPFAHLLATDASKNAALEIRLSLGSQC
jgi:hypothetical protein